MTLWTPASRQRHPLYPYACEAELVHGNLIKLIFKSSPNHN